MTETEQQDSWSQATALLAHALDSRTSGVAPSLVEVPDPTATAVVLADLSVALAARLAKDEASLTRWVLDLDADATISDALSRRLHI